MGCDIAPNSNLWTDSLLDRMRQLGDPIADAVIQQLFAEGEVAAVNSLMSTLVTNEFPEPETLPKIVREYLAQIDCLPDWAEPNLIRAGEEIFSRYGPSIILLLTFYSLPWDYLAHKGVQVLALTTRLLTDPRRRGLEVLQFVFDVLQVGGLTDGAGRGRRSIQKVRLMHAAVRRLAAASADWRPEWDLPINQEDLAGTLVSFSWIVLDGLTKLGITLPESDCEAYLHCWRVAGCMLGIRAELLTSNFESARALAETFERRQFGPSAQGQALTLALIGMMSDTPLGDVFQYAAPRYIRYFLGQQRAAWLGIQGALDAEFLIAPLRTLGIEITPLLENSRFLSQLAEKLGPVLIESLLLVERGGGRPTFAIPEDLRSQWK